MTQKEILNLALQAALENWSYERGFLAEDDEVGQIRTADAKRKVDALENMIRELDRQ